MPLAGLWSKVQGHFPKARQSNRPAGRLLTRMTRKTGAAGFCPLGRVSAAHSGPAEQHPRVRAANSSHPLSQPTLAGKMGARRSKCATSGCGCHALSERHALMAKTSAFSSVAAPPFFRNAIAGPFSNASATLQPIGFTSDALAHFL